MKIDQWNTMKNEQRRPVVYNQHQNFGYKLTTAILESEKKYCVMVDT